MTPKPRLKVALAQCELIANDVQANLEHIRNYVRALDKDVDLLVFPETCTTGFSVEAYSFSQPWVETGETYQFLQNLAQEHQLAIAGSMLVFDDKWEAYNRFFLFSSDEEVQYQDKRHLFHFGCEDARLKPAKERKVLTLKGWRILPLVCYDLRFPVWARCVECDYDLIICVANWPDSRQHVWSTLLQARAMENQCYVLGVNRVGIDSNGLNYAGGSCIVSPRGEKLLSCKDYKAECSYGVLSLDEVNAFRSKFPALRDADKFKLDNEK